MNDNKKNQIEIDKLIKQIEKDHGKESIMQLDNSNKNIIKTSSTGSFYLDRATGIGGYPMGRIIEIYGPESSGKTTLALHAISEIQKKGGIAAFIDAEHALNIAYAKNIGINTKTLLLSQPDSGEQALEITDALINSNSVDIIVIDSVAALTPKLEIDGEIGDHVIGAQARLMSKSLRRLSSSISKTNCLVIFINQIREKVGVVFGNPEITPGGRALKFYASLRLEIRAGEKIKEDNNFIGQKMKIKIIKNKISPPYKNCELELRYDLGINKVYEIIDLAVEYDLLEKNGSWYFLNKKKIAQGKFQLEKYFKENSKIFKDIENKLDTLIIKTKN